MIKRKTDFKSRFLKNAVMTDENLAFAIKMLQKLPRPHFATLLFVDADGGESVYEFIAEIIAAERCGCLL